MWLHQLKDASEPATRPSSKASSLQLQRRQSQFVLRLLSQSLLYKKAPTDELVIFAHFAPGPTKPSVQEIPHKSLSPNALQLLDPNRKESC